ncbi:MAG: ribonuclease catalytic domain-containing protein [Pseudomonadota bacterium]
MNQGKIIEYIDKGKLVCALCIQDKGGKLHLFTSSNREMNLSLKRALLISDSYADLSLPKEDQLNKLKQTEELRESLSRDIPIQEIWELVCDEGESFGYKYLAQLCFGDKVTDNHISALVRALFEDRTFFRMKDGRFFPNSGERIAQIVSQRGQETLREERLTQGSAWLREILQNRTVQPPPCKEEIIDVLIELAIHGNDAPDFKYGKELLLRAGVSQIEQARNLLVRLGVWEEDENLELIRLDIRRSFEEKLLVESDQLTQVKIELNGREDLRHLPVVTIDGPLTRDFDDALSMEVEGDTIHLGIHIADVAGLIDSNSPIDMEASQRGSSLYLPRCQIPMMPPNLSQNILSLIKGCDRGAISLLSRFDMDGNLIDYRFVPSLIRVQDQLTYEHVNGLYTQEVHFKQMYRLSQMFRQKRIDKGALILSLPELAVQIAPDSAVELRMIDQETPSRMIVAEFMIFYNWMVAKFCREHQIPILFRGQEEPSEKVSINEAGYIFFVFKQRRKLNPLRIDLEPKPHKGLGLDLYTNASSPIRRYLDLVIQRQLRNFLFENSPVYNEEELEKIRVSVTPVLKDHQWIKQRRTRYWVLKYLMQHTDEKFPALILDILKNRYRVLLTDFLMVAEMRRENGQNFSEGQSIVVRVQKSDPLNDLLILKSADAG